MQLDFRFLSDDGSCEGSPDSSEWMNFRKSFNGVGLVGRGVSFFDALLVLVMLALVLQELILQCDAGSMVGPVGEHRGAVRGWESRLTEQAVMDELLNCCK